MAMPMNALENGMVDTRDDNAQFTEAHIVYAKAT